MAVTMMGINQTTRPATAGTPGFSVRPYAFWGAGVVAVLAIVFLFSTLGNSGVVSTLIDAFVLAFSVSVLVVLLMVPFYLFRSWQQWRMRKFSDNYQEQYDEIASQPLLMESDNEVDLDLDLDLEFEKPGIGLEPEKAETPMDFLDQEPGDTTGDTTTDSWSDEELTIEAQPEPEMSVESDLFDPDVDQEPFVEAELESGEVDDAIGAATSHSESWPEVAQDLDETIRYIDESPEEPRDPVRDLEAHEFDLVCLRYVTAIGYQTPTSCKSTQGQVEFELKEKGQAQPFALVRCIPDPCVIEAEFLADVNFSMLKIGARCGILFTRFPVDPTTIKAAAAWDFEIIDSNELNQRLEALPASVLAKVVPASPSQSSAVTLDNIELAGRTQAAQA